MDEAKQANASALEHLITIFADFIKTKQLMSYDGEDDILSGLWIHNDSIQVRLEKKAIWVNPMHIKVVIKTTMAIDHYTKLRSDCD